MSATPRRLLIAGGGLSGGLITLALAGRADVTPILIEAGGHFGGNHVWSFFDSDVDAAGRALIEPLICHRWPGYDVRFPAFARTIRQPYNSIESERLDAVLRAALPADRLFTGRAIATFDSGGAILTDGTRIAADAVIDARGFQDAAPLDLGWQKFVGRLLRLEAPHGIDRPVVMDATVDQAEGYRFVYLLPFGPRHVFVEDTYYATDPTLALPAIGARIEAYAAQHGWRIAAVERQEQAALPIAMGGDIAALIDADPPVAKVGMAAGLFQPLTGYSLPDAVRTAQLIADAPDLSGPALRAMLRDHALATWRGRGYYRLLSRMLFRAAAPARRYRMLQRFYGLDEALIGRFYAGRSTGFDKARILCGRPPVPLAAAIKVVLGAR